MSHLMMDGILFYPEWYVITNTSVLQKERSIYLLFILRVYKALFIIYVSSFLLVVSQKRKDETMPGTGQVLEGTIH